MANRTAWSAGSLPGTTTGGFTAAFLAADLASLANLSSVLASVTFDNTVATVTTPDQFMDVSFVGALVSASTLAPGSGLGLWLAILQEDGVTYGDGRVTAGTQTLSTAWSPILNPIGGIPLAAGTGITNIAGSALNITIPPRKLSIILQNQTGFAFAASGCACSISTYRQNTNA
jgi:hypothetical protein